VSRARNSPGHGRPKDAPITASMHPSVVTVRPRWTYDLEHIAALDAARRRERLPEPIICRGCSDVPRNPHGHGAFHVSADGQGWECRRYPKCQLDEVP